MAGGGQDDGRSLVFTIGHWQPKIGDPSWVGWFIVFSYYLCAGLSLAAGLRMGPRMDPKERRLRILVTVVILVLGLGKHFNLPGAITELGRLVVHQLGGYEARRGLQIFVLLLVGLGLIVLILAGARRGAFLFVREHGTPEMIFLGVLGGLAVLRAISLHQVGAFLAADVGGVRLNWIVELSGIYGLVVVLIRRILAAPPRAEAGRR